MNGTWPRPVPHVGVRAVAQTLAILALLGLASCGGRGPIRIGMQGTYGGPLGRPQRFGAQLAVKQSNDAGGVGGG